MGNPNYRKAAERVPPTPEPIKFVQPPPVARCTNTACRVEKYHLAKTFDVGAQDLPTIVKAKHAHLQQALANQDYGSARAARTFLEAFYFVHGPADGSALSSLTFVPGRCKKPCGVKQIHFDTIYQVATNDMPQIITEKTKYLQAALDRGNYAKARQVRGFLVRFFSFHGLNDGSTLAALPAIPTMCKNKLCPCKSEHADKTYREDSQDLPAEMKTKVDRTYKAYYRHENWKDMKEQKDLNEFWAIHG